VALVLIQGGESLLAMRHIQSAVKLCTLADPELISRDGADLAAGDISAALAPSLFAENRIFILRHVEDLDGDASAELLAATGEIDPTLQLVIWHGGGIKGKAVLDQLKKRAEQILLAEPIKKESERVDFVHHEFARLGRKVSSEAASALALAVGDDLGELAATISQLASDIGGSATISLGDVNKYHEGKTMRTGFEVADAIMEGQLAPALLAYRQALNYGVEPIAILMAIASSMRTLIKVSGLNPGAKSFAIAGEVGVAPWQIEKARRQLRNWRPDSAKGALLALAELDAAVKSGQIDPAFGVEELILNFNDLMSRR
jgi:DNA polymerase-3 subunit delta